MVRERFQELVDFAKTESPYQSANKGWINSDVYLELGQGSNSSQKRNEFIKVDLFWNPLSRLLSSLFLIFIISTIFVFTMLLLSNGTLEIPINYINNSQKDSELISSSTPNDQDKLFPVTELDMASKPVKSSEDTNDSVDNLEKEAIRNNSIEKNTQRKTLSEKLEPPGKQNDKRSENVVITTKRSKTNFL